jgi:hypothetical protein
VKYTGEWIEVKPVNLSRKTIVAWGWNANRQTEVPNRFASLKAIKPEDDSATLGFYSSAIAIAAGSSHLMALVEEQN